MTAEKERERPFHSCLPVGIGDAASNYMIFEDAMLF